MIQIDIPMPKSCTECPFTYLDTGDDAYFGSTETRCVLDNSCVVDCLSTERMDDCPLREVEE